MHMQRVSWRRALVISANVALVVLGLLALLALALDGDMVARSPVGG
jgi:hypothetical protein